MSALVSGFDWDTGNRAKCQKHGVSVDEIEGLFARPVMILPDTAHATTEERLRAIGRTQAGRYVFLVFTLRDRTEIYPPHQRPLHASEGDRQL